MSNNINIVLVNTSHPGNIGSTARAMKTMGLNKLSLVNPKYFPSEQATAQAVGCSDILNDALLSSSLTNAISDSQLVVGFSARSRKSNIPSLSMSELMNLLKKYKNNKISIVFGNEQSGLTNNELLMCNYIVSIPTDDSYTSLNLSAAVQIFSYEYFMSNQSNSSNILDKSEKLAPTLSKKHLIDEFISIMHSLEMISIKNRNSIIQNIHIIFNKTNFTENEVNLYLGIITKIKKAIKK